MKTLKNGLNQENIDSNNLRIILPNYSHKECVKVALYCAEDCFYLNPKKEAKLCINLVKKWLKDKKSVTEKEFINASNAAWYSCLTNAAAGWASQAANSTNYYSVYNAVCDAAQSFDSKIEKESKQEEYLSYARLFAYEDLDFPYKDFAKTFNLDNPTELNIFLDFLTDNYPEAITFSREEYLTKRLPKEYLRIIYQAQPES